MTDVHASTDNVIKALHEIDQVVISSGPNQYTEMKVKGGTVKIWTLHRNENGHCVYSYIPKGCVMGRHDHVGSEETIVLVTGVMDMTYKKGGKEATRAMEVGRPAYLERGQAHWLTAYEDSYVYAILIPPDEGLKQK